MPNNPVISYGDLKVTLTSFFNPIWSDVTSCANRNGAFWHALLQVGDLRALGSVVVSAQRPGARRREQRHQELHLGQQGVGREA
jgi:hypothetical protein